MAHGDIHLANIMLLDDSGVGAAASAGGSSGRRGSSPSCTGPLSPMQTAPAVGPADAAGSSGAALQLSPVARSIPAARTGGDMAGEEQPRLQPRVFLVDFGRSFACVAPARLQQEMEDMRRLLRQAVEAEETAG